MERQLEAAEVEEEEEEEVVEPQLLEQQEELEQELVKSLHESIWPLCLVWKVSADLRDPLYCYPYLRLYFPEGAEVWPEKMDPEEKVGGCSSGQGGETTG